MALTKYKLRQLISLCTGGNETLLYGEDSLKGISVNKVFMPSKTDLQGESLKNYTVVAPKCFSFVTVTSRNGNKISIAYNDTEESFIVSSFYVTFKLNDLGKKVLLEEYLFLFFNRSEFDRYARQDSWGSAREYFYFENMCNVEIVLPPLPVQKKYVAIYKAMIANQQSYEHGLEDLKLVCDAYIDKIDKSRYEKIGRFIQRNQKKNQSVKFSKSDVKGINTNGYFIKPMRLFSGDISTFKIIGYNDFVYNSRINSTISRLSIALNEGEELIVTPAYESFYIVDPEQLFPYYLYMLLQRDRFARTVLFNSFGSSTVFFGLDDLSEIEIPVPTIEEQKAIANVYRQYKIRHDINERLKTQIKDLCPILIKGAVEEGNRT